MSSRNVCSDAEHNRSVYIIYRESSTSTGGGGRQLAYRKIIKNDILEIYRENLKLPEPSFSVQENKLNQQEVRCIN
ncbi:hypothetical protein [Thermoanaerobacter sp. YS13]|uniref:hypothetical protein n=1 Tax=Thermoanaerobacter sp. YS13 TaxID=1511746 RepID=UPI0007FB56AC|nr:hypothetical protein [Thermoanaerobacter sp. YS13]